MCRIRFIHVKEIYTCNKRPTNAKRDLYMSNETKHVQKKTTYICKNARHVCIQGEAVEWFATLCTQKWPIKRDLYMSKETCMCEINLMSVSQVRPLSDLRRCTLKRDLSKETYICQKRPICVKDTSWVHPRWGRWVICDVAHSNVTYQKRPIYVKRDLYV